MTDDNESELLKSSVEIDQTKLIDSAKEDIDEIKHERDEYHDLLLRKTAEFDNFRKRIERERLNINQSAAIDFIEELLPLIDDLERASSINTNETSVKSYHDGIQIIHRQLLELLAKRGVKLIETKDQHFDPHYHEAVAYEPSSNHHEGQIIGELRRGYMMREQLLRAALVRVAKE